MPVALQSVDDVRARAAVCAEEHEKLTDREDAALAEFVARLSSNPGKDSGRRVKERLAQKFAGR